MGREFHMDPRSGFISDFFNKVVFGLQILVSGGVWWCRGGGGWWWLAFVTFGTFIYISLHLCTFCYILRGRSYILRGRRPSCFCFFARPQAELFFFTKKPSTLKTSKSVCLIKYKFNITRKNK